MSPEFALHASSAAALALMHTLWQAAACALLFKLVTTTVGRQWQPAASYRAGVLCLIIIIAAPIICFTAQMWPSAGHGLIQPVAASAQNDLPIAGAAQQLIVMQPTMPGMAERMRESVQANASVIVTLWLVGCALFGLRLAVARAGIMRLLREPLPCNHALHEDLQTRIQQLAARAGLRKVPTLKVVVAGTGPFIFGVWHTVLAVPAALAGGISSDLMDALILHELAHIRRFDPLVNALQCAAETVLFYHPAVWWVSAQVRRERELCCDDCVLETLPNPAVYANALLAASELQLSSAALAAANPGSGLLHRIERILGMNSGRAARTGKSPHAAAFGLALAFLSTAAVVALIPAAGTASRAQTVRPAPVPDQDGVQIVLSDSKKPAHGRDLASTLIHDSDIQNIVNAVKGQAKQPITINGVAITRTENIRAHGPDIQVDGKPIKPPYIIKIVAKRSNAELLDALKKDDQKLKQLYVIDKDMITITTLKGKRTADGGIIIKQAAGAGAADDVKKLAWTIKGRILQWSPSSKGTPKVISSPTWMTFDGSRVQMKVGVEAPGGKLEQGMDAAITVKRVDASHVSVSGSLLVKEKGKEALKAAIPADTHIEVGKAVFVTGVTTSTKPEDVQAVLKGVPATEAGAVSTALEIKVLSQN